MKFIIFENFGIFLNKFDTLSLKSPVGTKRRIFDSAVAPGFNPGLGIDEKHLKVAGGEKRTIIIEYQSKFLNNG